MEKDKKILTIGSECKVWDNPVLVPEARGFYGIEVDSEIEDYSDKSQEAEALFQES